MGQSLNYLPYNGPLFNLSLLKDTQKSGTISPAPFHFHLLLPNTSPSLISAIRNPLCLLVLLHCNCKMLSPGVQFNLSLIFTALRENPLHFAATTPVYVGLINFVYFLSWHGGPETCSIFCSQFNCPPFESRD